MDADRRAEHDEGSAYAKLPKEVVAKEMKLSLDRSSKAVRFD